MRPFTRRKLLTGLAYSSFAPLSTELGQSGHQRGERNGSAGFLEIVRLPTAATAFLGIDQPLSLSRAGSRWQAPQISVRVDPQRGELPIYISASLATLTHVQLRWEIQVPENLLVLGDAWERSYGDLHWSGLVPERVMPWYFMTIDAHTLHAYGVKTGSGALCFWQLDPDGVSLWLDVSNGGSGVELRDRELLAATAVTSRGVQDEDLMVSATKFCAKLCDKPRLPRSVICGSNDWYYAYGNNSAQQILRDAELMRSRFYDAMSDGVIAVAISSSKTTFARMSDISAARNMLL